MGNIVLDTSVVSFIFKNDSRAGWYMAEITGMSPCISFQTWEELLYGAKIGKWGAQRMNDLARNLGQYSVIWPNEELVMRCAELRGIQKLAGRKLACADAWIAATALMLKCPLASHDRDFNNIPDLKLIRSQQ
ncbi:PIN domain-containing protein [Candidatus Poriferisocius sp.]|uniref:PIN domain-containing protein n=1 Tax=Candidatus Poriferisocius sp. TaxID=3101276 RepID=UPI003B028729